jgi:enamine deaminase RidA (YjgF/YER057c/UK114 family)
MADTSDTRSRHTARRRSRRAAMTAGLTALAGGATAATAAPAAQSPRDGTATRAVLPKKVAINRPDRKAPHPLLSHCVRSGNLLFLAGIGGWYPEDRAEPGDARVQTDSALKAMRLILETAGSSMASVLKVHMTVADPNRNLTLVNEGYRGHFPDPPPARSYSGCGVDQMGRDHVLIQIDCVAYVD